MVEGTPELTGAIPRREGQPVLIAVEGPPAVGKMTLLMGVPKELVVGEEPLRIPPRTTPEEVLRLGVALNERRWTRLLGAESASGQAYADSDPLKLYYGFFSAAVGGLPASWPIGTTAREVFEEGWWLHRESVIERRLGFVDQVVLLYAPPGVLKKARRGTVCGGAATSPSTCAWGRSSRRTTLRLNGCGRGRCIT